MVRWSDAADVDELHASAPKGLSYFVVPIDDEGTPDWIQPGGKQLIVDQGEIDRVVDDLLLDSNDAAGQP